MIRVETFFLRNNFFLNRAPEVIQETGYQYKVDIWSLGITAIELAEQRPPYSHLHPMRAIFMIPSKPPPGLENPDAFPAPLRDFIKAALVKNGDERPSAAALLEHAFVKAAGAAALLLPFIDETMKVIAVKGRDAALGLDEEGDDDDNGTAAAPVVNHLDAQGANFDFGGTTNFSDGTMISNASGGGDTSGASAMSQWAQVQYKQQALDKYESYTVEQLKAEIAKLEQQKKDAVAAIHAKFADRATAIKNIQS